MKRVKRIFYNVIDNPLAKLLGALCIIGPSLAEIIIEWNEVKNNFREEGLQFVIGIMMLMKIIAEIFKFQKKIARARSVFKSETITPVES